MALDSAALADAIYKRVGFQVYTGASSPGLVDELTKDITGNYVTEKNDDLTVANRFHEEFSKIVAEEVIDHLEANADVQVSVPLTISNIRTIAVSGDDRTDLAVVKRTPTVGGGFTEDVTQGTFDGTAIGTASIT